MSSASQIRYVLALIFLVGCRVYRVRDFGQPDVIVPQTYYQEAKGIKAVEEWWKEFDDPNLNRIIELGLTENLDLQQAWYRLDQAFALANIAGADISPQVSLQSGASRTRSVDRDVQDSRETRNRLFISNGLTYEFDLWKRIASRRKAAQLTYDATREDIEETALLLTGLIVDVWLTVQEQKMLLVLLEEQIHTGKTLLELTELRFGLGKGSALDVFQQRQQLASIGALVPVSQTTLATSENQLAVLLGRPPGHFDGIPQTGRFPELPELPRLGQPINLLKMRPDLRALLKRLKAADYEVAEAVADRFPRLSLSLSYEFSASKVSNLFTQELGSITGDLIAPLMDGKRRRNEVRRRQAVVQELLSEFGQRYLDALLEVENTLVSERQQLELITRLENQISFAQSTLEESRSRYVNGLDDYLSVIIAVQSLQEVQRQMISEKKSLLAIRANLYRALGGYWTKKLEHPDGKRGENTETWQKVTR